jgi:hypothetical protein
MEVYSSNTSDIIRYDFVKFSKPRSAGRTRVEEEARKVDSDVKDSLKQLRTEMENDNGLGSYGSYKCPIF